MVQTDDNVILPISAGPGAPQNGPQNRLFWRPFLEPPAKGHTPKITLSSVWGLNVSMDSGASFGTPILGVPPIWGPHPEQVLMGNPFVCPHVYSNCCSGRGSK